MENNSGRGNISGNKFFNKKILIILGVLVLLVAGSGAALVKASDNPAFCTACHIMKPYYQSWHDGNLLAEKHAQAKVACHDCHESSIAIQASEGIKFITGNYKTPLEQRNFSKDFCLNCHSESGTGTPKGMSFDTAKTETDFAESNPHDSHNGEQECNLCHSMHRQSEVMCAQCHSFTWMQELDSSWAKQ